MSLDPSPLSPRPTPLLNPTDPVPGRGSALIGGAVAVALAVVIAFVSLTAGTHLLYLPQGLQAHANAVVDQLPQIQGFSDYWTKSFDVGSTSVGYANRDVNQEIMSDEATTYHMNLVVITITADMEDSDIPDINFNASDHFTYSDSVYENLVRIARHNNLTPIFRLEVRLFNNASRNYASTFVGYQWIGSDPSQVDPEVAWFNNYARFASHYAALAQRLSVPMLIIGSDLAYITVDNQLTGQTSPLKKVPGKRWGNSNDQCYGRRDCEWRFVIHAIKSASYTPLYTKKATTGGGYSGTLTFAATAPYDTSGQKYYATPEWQNITFWDDLNVIGIDAFFPLTNGVAEPTPDELVKAWKGTYLPGTTPDNPEGNIFESLRKLSARYNKRILFTGAGYESVSGATKTPGSYTGFTAAPDPVEQQNDMEALLQTFSNETWWLGVIWSYDYPVWPRSKLTNLSTANGNDVGLAEPDYDTNTEWAGKAGGTYLSQFYQNAPLPDTLWQTLAQQY